jgi:hypothetical protein
MRRILFAAALLAASIIPASADVFGWTPWGFVPLYQTGPFGGWRIPPGFQAPPLPSPYARTIAEQFTCCGPRPPNVIQGPPPPPDTRRPPREFPIK